MDLVIFPGKNTPIKRYRSYFRGYNLREIEPGEKPSIILCHSIGITRALEYCTGNDVLNTAIICMDGVEIEMEIPGNIRIYMFRPVDKHVSTDVKCEQVIRYDIDTKIRHHPYMDKKTRDKIIKLITTYK